MRFDLVREGTIENMLARLRVDPRFSFSFDDMAKVLDTCTLTQWRKKVIREEKRRRAEAIREGFALWGHVNQNRWLLEGPLRHSKLNTSCPVEAANDYVETLRDRRRWFSSAQTYERSARAGGNIGRADHVLNDIMSDYTKSVADAWNALTDSEMLLFELPKPNASSPCDYGEPIFPELYLFGDRIDNTAQQEELENMLRWLRQSLFV